MVWLIAHDEYEEACCLRDWLEDRGIKPLIVGHDDINDSFVALTSVLVGGEPSDLDTMIFYDTQKSNGNICLN